MTKTCLFCGKEFRVKPSSAHTRKLCSKACQSGYYKIKLRGSANPNYHSAKKTIRCAICGKEFSYFPSIGHRVCCSRACSSKYRSMTFVGDNNPAWNGGEIGYYGPNWIIQKELALQRDKNICQDCGITQAEYGRTLDVHHIKPFKICADYSEANQLSNLISVCKRCHAKREKQARKKYGIKTNSSPVVQPRDSLSPKEAALMIGITTWTLYHHIEKNHIQALNLAENIAERKRPRFAISLEEIERFIRSRE